MKKIVNNEYNLNESEITDFTRKVKLLIFNSKNQILLAYAYNNYEFPGGTQEKDEELIQTIRREILEETGIKLNISDLQPFACSISYYKDWPEKGRNKKIEIYYYELLIDEKPNLSNLNLTESEKKGNFMLKYIKYNEVEKEIINNIKLYGDSRGIGKEMLNLLNVYKNLK